MLDCRSLSLTNHHYISLSYFTDRSLRVPSFLIFGELDTDPGSGLQAAEQLHALLSDRLSEVFIQAIIFSFFIAECFN